MDQETFVFARVVKWYTRSVQNAVSQDVEVRVLSRALESLFAQMCGKTFLMGEGLERPD